MNTPTRSFAFCFITMLLLALPETSWALQPHGPPEGLYVHQMSHILFMGALAYLYLHTRKTSVLISKGWRYLRLFCLLLFLWNLLAFTGHIMAIHISNSDFIAKGSWNAQLASPLNFSKIVYFLSRMDHLIYAPGLFALMISLRTFYLEARDGEEK